MSTTIRTCKKLLFIALVAYSLLFSKASSAQCISHPPCMMTGLNTLSHNSWATDWQITDPSGIQTTITNPSPLTYSFADSGIYIISIGFQLPGGGPWVDDCTDTVYITTTTLFIQSITTNTICEGSSIDTADINLEVFNSTGNLSFNWVTQPSGLTYTGISTGNINNTESSITLTVTDNNTNCSDQTNISLNYLTTNISPPTISTSPNNTCAGTPIDFIITNSDTSLYNYSWDIQNNSYNGDSITTTLSSTPTNNVSITINITNISNNCEVSFFETIPISSSPSIILDTNLNWIHDQYLKQIEYNSSHVRL